MSHSFLSIEAGNFFCVLRNVLGRILRLRNCERFGLVSRPDRQIDLMFVFPPPSFFPCPQNQVSHKGVTNFTLIALERLRGTWQNSAAFRVCTGEGTSKTWSPGTDRK